MARYVIGQKGEVAEFFKGLQNKDQSDKIDEGSISSGKNWIVRRDRIELRRGSLLLGADASAGKVTGLRSGVKQDGTEILHRTRARKIEYYDTDTELWVENGTNVIPLGASGEDIALENYQSLTGSMMYVSSPNSSIYKIMLANPDDITDLARTNFRGKIKIDNRRILVWDRITSNGTPDKTSLNGSKLDRDQFGDYTDDSLEITGEVVGASGFQAYAGTLAFKAGGAKRTCFAIQILESGGETFTDDGNGTLTGDAGGTGTINYTTGAYSVTFNAVTSGAVTADYFFVDDTSGGIADFSFSATRVAGEGFVLQQSSGGGDLMAIKQYDSLLYCIHKRKTWTTSISATDDSVSNIVYREKVGIENCRGAVETGEGIYYVDTSDARDVKIRLLQIAGGSTKVIPISISDELDLSGYDFTDVVGKEWGDYIVFACKVSGDAQNNRFIIYDRRLKLFLPEMDYQAYTLEEYNGALVGGDSTTNNVYELFSGFDDDNSLIPNNIIMNETELGMKGLMKRPRKLILEGDIQPDQILEIYVRTDKGSKVLIHTLNGTDDEVDSGSSVSIGATVIGKNEVGGGGSGATANHYQLETTIALDKGETFQFEFEAIGIGYVSVSRYGFKDIRIKSGKSPNKYIN